MTTCPRCHGTFREVGTETASGERCKSLVCYNCGNVEDRTIRENRTPERREFWRKKTSAEQTEPLSRREKIILEYEPEAIRFSF